MYGTSHRLHGSWNLYLIVLKMGPIGFKVKIFLMKHGMGLEKATRKRKCKGEEGGRARKAEAATVRCWCGVRVGGGSGWWWLIFGQDFWLAIAVVDVADNFWEYFHFLLFSFYSPHVWTPPHQFHESWEWNLYLIISENGAHGFQSQIFFEESHNHLE